LSERHTVWQLVKIASVVCDEPPDGPSRWAHTRKLDIFAEVVLAGVAEPALPARDSRLDRYPVAGLDVRHIGPDGEYNTGRLVSEDTLSVDDKRSDCATVPEMHVAAANAGATHMDKSFLRARRRNLC